MFQVPLLVQPNILDTIVLADCYLHYLTQSTWKREENIIYEREIGDSNGSVNIEPLNRSPIQEGIEVCDTFKNGFVSPEEQILWQMQAIRQVRSLNTIN